MATPSFTSLRRLTNLPVEFAMATLDEHLIELAEGFDFEVKAGLGAHGRGELPKDFWPTYSAFANTYGGVVILGVKEPNPGTFEVVGLPEPERIERALWPLLNDKSKVSANLLQEGHVRILSLDGKRVLRIEVPRAPRRLRPVFIHGNPLTGTYKRLHEGDHHCPEDEVKRMLAEQPEGSRDSRVLEHFGWEDLDMETFSAYRIAFQNRKPGHVFADQPNEAFLQSVGGWARDRERGVEGLTVAGLLMFGRYRSILEEFPNYTLDYRDLPADPKETRYLDRLVTDGLWSGNLYDFYRRVYIKLTADLKVPFLLKGDERQEETPVHEAIREALANCLIHADYTGRRSVLVVRRPSFVGFRNPGGMRVPVDQAILGGESDCRNRSLQNLFFLIGRGDKLGSGIPTIFRNWSSQHWRQPEITEELEPQEQTLVRLRAESLLPDAAVAAVAARFGERFQNLEEVARIALVTVEVEGYLTHGRLSQLCERHPHDLSRLLAHLVETGFLESDKRGRGTSYRFPGTGEFQVDDSNRDGSYSPFFSSSHSAQRSTPTEPSSTHMDPSSSHKEATSTHNGVGPDSADPTYDAALWDMAAPIRSTARATPEKVKAMIIKLCEGRFLTLQQLSQLLNRHPAGLRGRLLSPMVRAHQLEWRYPNNPNHEQQAYRAVKP